jgi:hypothetical protein
VLESAKPETIPVEFSNQEHQFEVEAFRISDGGALIAVWLPEEPADDSPEVMTDLILAELKFSRATGIDALNGTEQQLNIAGGGLPGMLIKDSPIFVRFEKA